MTNSYKRIRKLASSTGTVAYYRSSANEFLVTVWNTETDEHRVVERFGFRGHLDEIAARAMVHGYVDSYAASN